MDKTLSFMQFGSKEDARAALKRRATKNLIEAGRKARDPRMSLLATSMKLADFAMVKEKVQKMIDDLVLEKEEEIKRKNDCNTDIFENEKAIAAKTREKGLLENSIADMTTKIGNLKDEIATLEAEIADAHVDQRA